MPPGLDDLLNDSRLARLFSKEDHPCALQLWILQIKFEQSIENRVVYGRLLPYRHSSNEWSARKDDHFKSFRQFQAQVVRLNLYVSSIHCANILGLMNVGQTVCSISGAVKLGLPEQLRSRFGSAALTVGDLAYRPVAYLLNRDGHEKNTPSSPHGGAGAYSDQAGTPPSEVPRCRPLGGGIHTISTREIFYAHRLRLRPPPGVRCIHHTDWFIHTCRRPRRRCAGTGWRRGHYAGVLHGAVAQAAVGLCRPRDFCDGEPRILQRGLSR